MVICVGYLRVGSNPGGDKRCFSSPKVQTGSGAQQESYPLDTDVPSRGYSGDGVNFTTRVPSSSQVKNGAGIHPLRCTPSWRRKGRL